ncbi:hypothetical protein ACNJUT_21740, partial [Mycobacterium tuberculosis]
MDAPLVGEEASASVETPPQPWPEPAPRAATGSAPRPSVDPSAELAPAAAIAAVAATAPFLHAPEPKDEAPSVLENTAHPASGTLDAPPFPAEPPANAFGFRGFEPPPPRFARMTDEPPAAA